MRGQAERLILRGANAVLIKGGHGEDEESVDLLVGKDTVARFAAPRIATPNTHGTGCTLSSAIAAGLAKGLSCERRGAGGEGLRVRRHRGVGPVEGRRRARAGASLLSLVGRAAGAVRQAGRTDGRVRRRW